MLKFNPTFRSNLFFQIFLNFFERDIKFSISSKCMENGVSRILKCLSFVSRALGCRKTRETRELKP
jgi:hypothetical protein